MAADQTPARACFYSESGELIEDARGGAAALYYAAPLLLQALEQLMQDCHGSRDEIDLAIVRALTLVNKWKG